MSSKKQMRLVYGVVTVLLVVGVISYAAFPPAVDQENPDRIMFVNPAGNVLFGHQAHADDYGFSCFACHHHPDESAGEEPVVVGCAECHALPKDGSLPAACLDCHDESMVDLTGVPDKTEAFHVQCIQCHKDSGVNFIECAECHPI